MLVVGGNLIFWTLCSIVFSFYILPFNATCIFVFCTMRSTSTFTKSLGFDPTMSSFHDSKGPSQFKMWQLLDCMLHVPRLFLNYFNIANGVSLSLIHPNQVRISIRNQGANVSFNFT